VKFGVNPDTAGIDIGATEIFVAVPADRDPEPVRSLATFTEDLHRLADWLESCGIETVAMESTGVYWIPLFQILEVRGPDEIHNLCSGHCTKPGNFTPKREEQVTRNNGSSL
jgi:hypothetical protein